MSLVQIEEKVGYLHCVVPQFDLMGSSVIRLFREVLNISRDTGTKLMLVDVTANYERVSLVEKAKTGLRMVALLRDYQKSVATLPRIAVVGNTSNVTTSKPAQKLLQAAGFPFATFTDEAAAKAWLFEEEESAQPG
jgi:hypothetical protein